MNPFVRFIFTILVVGIVVNISVIFLANAQSQRRQLRLDKKNQVDYASLLVSFDQRLRRADIIVESQRINHDGTAIESTLLARQYHSTGADQSSPAIVQRVVIPGDRLAIYGTLLEFNNHFADNAPEFRSLRGKKLIYFSFLCGENEKPLPNQPDTRFTFMPQWETPDLTCLDIFTPHPSLYEVRLWKYIWNSIPEERHPVPWSTNPKTIAPEDWKNGLNATFLSPAVITVRLKHIYSAWATVQPGDTQSRGKIELDEDPQSISQLTEIMIEQMKYQETLPQSPAATAPASIRQP